MRIKWEELASRFSKMSYSEDNIVDLIEKRALTPQLSIVLMDQRDRQVFSGWLNINPTAIRLARNKSKDSFFQGMGVRSGDFSLSNLDLSQFSNRKKLKISNYSSGDCLSLQEVHFDEDEVIRIEMDLRLRRQQKSGKKPEDRRGDKSDIREHIMGAALDIILRKVSDGTLASVTRVEKGKTLLNFRALASEIDEYRGNFPGLCGGDCPDAARYGSEVDTMARYLARIYRKALDEHDADKNDVE